MIVGYPDLHFCLGRAEDMAHNYQLNWGACTRRSITRLYELCGSYLEKKVILKTIPKVSAQDGSIRGYYLKYDDRYEIYLLAGMNFCWQRFVLCKELFHVVLDDDRYLTTDLCAHIEEAINKISLAVMAGPALVSEALAEMAAMEFMFPFAEREKLAGPQDTLAIADRYKTPQALIDSYLNPGFVASLKQYYQTYARTA